MYMWNEAIRAYSIRGWNDVAKQGQVLQDLFYDPRDLTEYRRRYIRRAIRTGIMPDKEGPTNAMCRMLMWRCGAAFEIRTGNYATYLYSYDHFKTGTVLGEMPTMSAKVKLLHAAGNHGMRGHTSPVPTVLYVDNRFQLDVEKQSKQGLCHAPGTLDRIPHGAFVPPSGHISMIVKVDHEYGPRTTIANMFAGIVGSPWHSDEGREFAMLQMDSAFQMRLTTTHDRLNYDTTDRAIHVTNR